RCDFSAVARFQSVSPAGPDDGHRRLSDCISDGHHGRGGPGGPERRATASGPSGVDTGGGGRRGPLRWFRAGPATGGKGTAFPRLLADFAVDVRFGLVAIAPVLPGPSPRGVGGHTPG